jgi:arsenate reductase
LKTVLFACVHNAGRSQIAAALFDALVDRAKASAISAGTEPAARVHPEVVAALAERGIDRSSASPQKLTPELASNVDVLVTMGCGETCPVVPGVELHDWPIEDPKGKPVERVREIVTEIEARVRAMLAERGWLKAR